jgi:hypothetical protein
MVQGEVFEGLVFHGDDHAIGPLGKLAQEKPQEIRWAEKRGRIDERPRAMS